MMTHSISAALLLLQSTGNAILGPIFMYGGNLCRLLLRAAQTAGQAAEDARRRDSVGEEG